MGAGRRRPAGTPRHGPPQREAAGPARWHLPVSLHLGAGSKALAWRPQFHRCPACPPPPASRFRGEEWSYFRGGLTTIDRDYGIFNKIHHDIGTHVVHHLFPQVRRRRQLAGAGDA